MNMKPSSSLSSLLIANDNDDVQDDDWHRALLKEDSTTRHLYPDEYEAQDTPELPLWPAIPPALSACPQRFGWPALPWLPGRSSLADTDQHFSVERQSLAAWPAIMRIQRA
jgi:hypothetical protein